ncbi:MAG: glycosyltransferase 87 family protein [Myxococcota bacterium]
MRAGQLKTWIGRLGAVNAVCFAAHALLSYALTPVMGLRRTAQLREAESFAQLAQALDFLGPGVVALVSGRGALAEPEAFLFAYCLPLALSTAVFLALLALLARHARDLEADTARALLRWTALFAAVSVLASPALAQDFWLSAAWGRMVVAGVNPYYADLTHEIARGLPFDDFTRQMTYGPLWALISGAVMWLAGDSALAAALLFKLLLAGAWVATATLIWRLLSECSPWSRCAGVAIFGWLPLSVHQTVAEGHNDVFMVLLVLLWLHWLQRGHPLRASLALAASVSIKYVTAPLFLLDLLYLRYSQGRRISEYLPRFAAAGALLVLTFGVFYRSTDFFAATTSMAGWHLFAPSYAVSNVGHLAGIDVKWLAWAVRALFPLLALVSIAGYCRAPSREALWRAALAIMSAVSFSLVGHVWPWFLLWILALAALTPQAALARWGLGVALSLPFPILIFTVPSWTLRMLFIASLIPYAFALAWLLVVPRGWLPPVRATEPNPAGA